MPNGLASSIVILTSPKRATPHSITRQQPATPIPAFSLCCSGYFKTMPYPCMNTSTGTNDLPMSTGWSFRTSWSDLIFTTKKRMGLLSSTMPIYLTTRYGIFRERSLLLRHPLLASLFALLALCPVLHRRDDYATEATRYPLFWIPYLELQPYVRQMPAMASSLNNSMNGTVDDFSV